MNGSPDRRKSHFPVNFRDIHRPEGIGWCAASPDHNGTGVGPRNALKQRIAENAVRVSAGLGPDCLIVGRGS